MKFINHLKIYWWVHQVGRLQETYVIGCKWNLMMLVFGLVSIDECMNEVDEFQRAHPMDVRSVQR